MKNLLIILCISLFIAPCFSQKYENFKVSVYCTADDVSQMGDTAGFLKPRWNEMSKQLKIDKVYIETHRNLFIVNQETLDKVKQFFKSRDIEVAGGITYTTNGYMLFQSFCYDDPEDRKKVKEIAEYTAKNFNEVILDDFYFTNCKSDGAIKDKGDRSWTDYRLEKLTQAAQDLIVGPAKMINPDVKVIIKYPNWYEHFQGLGFNLEREPGIFDGIYTGNETRDAVLTDQHLQPYLGYHIFRYFENIAPGRNGGGWIDPFAIESLDRYSEQLWITAFAKAPEITLFHFGQLSRSIESFGPEFWEDQETSFNVGQLKGIENTILLANAAGKSLETADKIIGKVGKPVGIKSYRPHHSTGEDFLQTFLGMIGLPMDERPNFPSEDSIILLTEKAKFDVNIVQKIKDQLTQGKTVVITSGLLRELQNKGLDDIVELRYTDRKALVQDFTMRDFQLLHIEKPVLLQQIQYYTNDAWDIVSGISGPNGWPILLMAHYSKGKLFVLTIPDNFADLYNLPLKVLDKIREILCDQLDISIQGPSNISLYLYDNNTFIVESFLDTEAELKVVTNNKYNKITDLSTDESYKGEYCKSTSNEWIGLNTKPKNTYGIKLEPHSFRIFSYE